MSPTLHSILVLVFVFLSSSAQLLEGCNDGYAEVEEYKLECEVLGGDLVSIHSAEENDFVLSLLAPPDKSKEGYTAWTWTSGMCPGMKCEWIDGTAWDFDMFKDGQPNAGGYVVIDAEGWSDVGFDSWGNTDAICKIFP